MTEAAFKVRFPLGFEEPEGFAIRFEAPGTDRLEFGRGLYLLDGPNGAGKSTFLNLLALLVGRIGGGGPGGVVYDGCDYRDPGFDGLRAADLRERCFAVFPQRAFFLPVSTRDNYRILNGRDPRRALAFSERESPLQLSGGQQQQVLMQIVLDPHKPVWFLDEPLASLDGRRRLAFWRLLAEGWGGGVRTVFLIDHLMAARIRKARGVVPCGRLRVAAGHRGAAAGPPEVKSIRLYHAVDPRPIFRRQIDLLERAEGRSRRKAAGAARAVEGR